MVCLRNRAKWQSVLARWFLPINLRPKLQAQGACDSILALAFTLLFLCELARPGTLTPSEVVQHMSKYELRRYLGFYLWYAFMYLVQLTVSLLLYMDVRNVKCNVVGRRRTIFLFLLFSPTLLVNLILSAANVLYFPWAPLGVLYVLHTLLVAPYWLYAFRYYQILGDSELVLFEAPLVGSAAACFVDPDRPDVCETSYTDPVTVTDSVALRRLEATETTAKLVNI